LGQPNVFGMYWVSLMCMICIGSALCVWHVLGQHNVYGMYWASIMYMACIGSA